MYTRLSILLIVGLFFCLPANAQTDSIKTMKIIRPKVGIFVPLYLDSTFSGNHYNYGSNVPKFALPGLEFYNGVKIALDSLNQEGLSAEVFIVDSKDQNSSIQNHINYDMNDVSLLIGMTQSPTELKILADEAKKRSIPFISATLPNDGGITNNPSLVILNSTLKSHCQAIYKYVQKNHFADNIILLHKTGQQEDKIRYILQDANKNAPALKLGWKYFDMGKSFISDTLVSLLDSTKNNVIICGSLDAGFSTSLLKQLSSLRSNYRCTAIGMPTWDDLSAGKADFKGVEMVYSTPFLTSSGNSKVYSSVAKQFKNSQKSRPSDMVFRGFEVAYHFIKNLMANPAHVLDLSDHSNRIFSDFDLQAVTNQKQNTAPDYYENKKLYFIKKLDGSSRIVF